MNKNVPNETKSIAQKVREVLMKRPFIINALTQNIVNYSALGRMIQKEIGVKNLEAVKAAIRRERKSIMKQRGFQEKKVLKLLKNTKVNLQDKIAVVISEKEIDIPYIVTADITKHHVYVVDQTKLEIEEEGDVTINKDLVALILTSPESLEDVPGVIAFISQLLASQNINIKEFISCYTDTIIVLDHQDALNAFSLLQQYI